MLPGRMRLGIDDGKGGFRRAKRGDDVNRVWMILEIKEGSKWKPIAKRDSGQPWIAIEPGWKVRGSEPGNYDSMSIEYDPPDTH